MAVRDQADFGAALVGDRLRNGGRGLAGKQPRRRGPRPPGLTDPHASRGAEGRQSPRLLPVQEMQRLRRAPGLCVAHLRPIGLWRRRRGRLADLLAFGVFVVLLAGGAVLALAVWRGPAP